MRRTLDVWMANLRLQLTAVEAAATGRKKTVLDLAHELLEQILHRGLPSCSKSAAASASFSTSPRSPPQICRGKEGRRQREDRVSECRARDA
jgi:hypothetical protein